MATKRPISVQGTAKAPSPPKGAEYKVDHSEYWDKALNNALRAAATDWSRGPHDIAITQYARMSVTNPGKIVDYIVVLTHTP